MVQDGRWVTPGAIWRVSIVHDYTSMVGIASGVEECDMETMENVAPGDPRRDSEMRTCPICSTSSGMGSKEGGTGGRMLVSHEGSTGVSFHIERE